MRIRAALFAVGLLMPVGANAAEPPPDFFEVPQYDQPFAGWAEPTLFTTYVASSDQPYDHFGNSNTRRGLWAHSLEVEYGATDRLTLGGYLDFESPQGGSTKFVQGRLIGRWRFADRQDLFVNPAIYVEYYIPDHAWGDQQLEIRGIMDKDIEDFRVVADPTISFTTTGSSATGTPSLGFAGGVYWRRFLVMQPGIEYYAEYGQIDQIRQTKQYVLPTLDFQITPNLRWHVGAGFGVTHASDKFVVESQLTLETDLIRPSVLFGK